MQSEERQYFRNTQNFVTILFMREKLWDFLKLEIVLFGVDDHVGMRKAIVYIIMQLQLGSELIKVV